MIIHNNFNKLKERFTDDTGLPLTPQNMPIYIAYVQALSADAHAQATMGVYSKLGEILDVLKKEKDQ